MDLPRAFFVNKMDREHADFAGVVEELRVRFGTGVVPIRSPIGKEAAFQGVVDLLALHIRLKERDENNCIVVEEIPEYMTNEVEEARQKLIEAVAEFNNELLEKYIEGVEIAEEEVAAALIEGIQAGKIFPVLCGSAMRNVGCTSCSTISWNICRRRRIVRRIGMDPETEELVERSTEDAFSAQVFKTIVDPFVGRLSFYPRILG